MFGLPIGHISVLLLIPVLGAALLILVPRRQTRTLFSLATLASALDFLWSVKIFALFDGATGEMQLVERAPWMPSFGIQYLVGIDGISLFLVLLTTLLMPVAILASWSVKERVKEYLIFMLLLETGMLGAFVALDLFLFYVFWEVMLVPMYFLIGVWGGTRRIYAALKFVVYHHGRQFAHAGGDYLSGDPPRAGGAGTDLRCLETLRPAPAARSAALAVSRLRAVLRDQGAAVSLPYLVARCPRRSADRRLGHLSGCFAEAGHLRLPALRHTAFPRRSDGARRRSSLPSR